MTPNTSLKRNFISGVLWETLKKYSQYSISIVITAILARLLTPQDFGIVAMVLVYHGFVQIFTESGISSAVVQRKELDHEDLSTVFWFSVFLGLILVLLTIFLAPLLEEFFNQEGLSQILKVMSLDLFMISVSAVPLGLLRRELKFRLLAFINLSALVISSIAAIYMAYTNWGYWALIVKIMASTILSFLPIFYYSSFNPKFSFSKQVLKKVLSYSLYITGFRSINYWARNADNLFIGKFIGSGPLGYYNQAYKLLKLPVDLLSGVLSSVLHPIFSKLKNDKERFGRNYLKVLEVIAVFSFPLGVFLYFNSYEIIMILWGDQWLKSVPVFKILAVLTLFQPITSTIGGVLMAADRVDLLFLMGIMTTLVMVIGIYIGLDYGITGVAAGYTISYMVFAFPFTMYLTLKNLKIGFKDFFKILKKPLLCAIVLAVSLGFTGLITNYKLSYLLDFIIKLLVSGTIFLLFIKFWYEEKIRELFSQK